MSSEKRTTRILFRDSLIRVVAKLVDFGNGAALSCEGIIIEARYTDATGDTCWCEVSKLPRERMEFVLRRVVEQYALGWDRGECPWVDWTAAGAKP